MNPSEELTATFAGIVFNNNDTTWMFDGDVDLTYQTAFGLAWWLSLLWICAHIWYPWTERLAKTEK